MKCQIECQNGVCEGKVSARQASKKKGNSRINNVLHASRSMAGAPYSTAMLWAFLAHLSCLSWMHQDGGHQWNTCTYLQTVLVVFIIAAVAANSSHLLLIICCFCSVPLSKPISLLWSSCHGFLHGLAQHKGVKHSLHISVKQFGVCGQGTPSRVKAGLSLHCEELHVCPSCNIQP